MKKYIITALFSLSVCLLSAQQAVGCFEIIEGTNSTIEVRFNVSSTFNDSNIGARNRISRGEITIGWTGPGEISGFNSEEYPWFNDGSSDNSVQYRFGPINQITTFTAGESILLLTLNVSERNGILNILSSDLINLLNEDLASDGSCPTSFDLGSLLPVNLSAFTADAFKNSKTLLQWETQGETDNDFFGIEHSLDGIYFEEIGRIEGSGTTEGLMTYKHYHDTPAVGTNFYRLRQNDFDGSYSYSDIASVKIEKEFNQVEVYPNPTSEALNVKISGNIGGVQINLIDGSGRLHMNKKIEAQILSTTILVGQLPRGIYWLHIEGNDGYHSQKIILR